MEPGAYNCACSQVSGVAINVKKCRFPSVRSFYDDVYCQRDKTPLNINIYTDELNNNNKKIIEFEQLDA
jgi:hypothetical protein